MTDNKDKKDKLIYANQLLIKTRWFYLAALVITGILNNISGIAGVNLSRFTLLILMAGVIIINFIYYFYFLNAGKRGLKSIQIISVFQITVDTFFLIVTILFTGGIISVSFLYLTFAIIASGFFYQLRGVILATTGVSMAYGLLLWGQFLELIPYFPRYNSSFEIDLAHSFWPVFINSFTIIVSFIMIGYFVGNFSRNINRKEKEVINERDKSDAIIANLLDGLIFIGGDQKISMVNNQAERLLDFSADKAIGKSVEELNLREFILLDQLFNRQKPKSEMKPVTKPEAVYEIDTIEINNREGHAIGTLKIVHDVSRERFMEKMKSEFITIAGHQLRTPLSAIKGAVDLVISDSLDDKEQEKKILKEVYKYNDRMISLVDDLLAASSIEEGRYDYKFEAIDIKFFLKDIEEQYQSAALDQAIGLEVKLANNAGKVELDQYKLKLALGAVINNALTYTALGGKISIKAEFVKEDKIQFSIRDNGIGIPEDQQDKVFTKFFRADNALKYQTEGNGLDLFVAKNIIEKHHGKISFESEEGFGTTFYIELPVKQPQKRADK